MIEKIMPTFERYKNDLGIFFESAKAVSDDEFMLSIYHVVDLPELKKLIEARSSQQIGGRFKLSVLTECLHSFTNHCTYIDHLDSVGEEPEFMRVYPRCTPIFK